MHMFKRRAGRVSAGMVLASFALAASLVNVGISSSASAASSGGKIPAAVAELKKVTTRPAQLQTTTPIGKSIPSGKTIDWIVCGSPLCTVLTQPLQAAAKVLGWKVDAIPGGLSPETILDAWNLAVQNHPDAVMASGFPEAVFSSALAQLKTASVPVINAFVTDKPGNGVTATVMSQPSEYNNTGKAMADYAIGTGGKSTNALFVYGSTFAADVLVEKGYQKESTKLCPSCGLSTLNVPESDVGTTLPSVVTGYLTTHPKINYVVLGEGSFESGIPQALQTAGMANRIKVVGQYPTQGSLQDLSLGKISALVMTEQSDAMWQMSDALARHFAGVSVTPSEASSPVWVVTTKTASQVTPPYYVVKNYQKLYKKLWGK
jgi:ribose transport system substrate-binding protein